METASMTDVSATATSSALPPLTTQFVQQGDCANIWHVTSLVTQDTSYYYYSRAGARSSETRTYNRTVTLLESTAAGEQFASCQPSGWSPGFSFSPAVCPSGWTYYGMTAPGTIVSSYRSIHSVAACCASGFTPAPRQMTVLASITEPCYREIVSETRIVDNAGSTHLIARGIQVHQPWHVSWKESETDDLPLSLPALTSSMWVPTWVPGKPIPSGWYQGNGRNSTSLGDMEGVIWFLIIGVPMISLALIGSCVWCCVHNSRVRRREKLRALQEQMRRAYEAAPGVPLAAPTASPTASPPPAAPG